MCRVCVCVADFRGVTKPARGWSFVPKFGGNWKTGTYTVVRVGASSGIRILKYSNVFAYVYGCIAFYVFLYEPASYLSARARSHGRNNSSGIR